MESDSEVEEYITKEDYLKNLDLQDFLNCSETKEILETEAYNKFERGLKHSLMYLFSNVAKSYSSDVFLKNDYLGDKNKDIFSELVYNSITPNYNLQIFYDDPDLAKQLLK